MKEIWPVNAQLSFIMLHHFFFFLIWVLCVQEQVASNPHIFCFCNFIHAHYETILLCIKVILIWFLYLSKGI